MNDTSLNESHKKLLQNYIRAKDNNKPHIMKAVFTQSATLEMEVKTDCISFPSQSTGLDEITNILVKNFNQTYENIYTFCLIDSVKSKDKVMSCRWLVGMSERESGNVRVGCGSYNWRFSEDKNPLADSLKISIEQMLILTPEHSEQIMIWLNSIPYPFIDSKTVLKLIPDIKELKQLDMI